jgi:hypothetical protein
MTRLARAGCSGHGREKLGDNKWAGKGPIEKEEDIVMYVYQ